MLPDPLFFRDLAYVFAAAVVGGGLAWLARQPLILGYVLGGLMVSPLTPGPAVSDLHTFELFAEIGVILLMFTIGIEFSLKDLLRVKWVALGGGPLGIVLSVVLGLAVAAVAGWPPLQGVMIGIVISVASTMVLARLLLDRGELHTGHGRVMIGITLVEDLAVVVLTVLVPALGSLEPGRLLAVAVAIGKSLAILAPVAYLAAKVVPALMTRVVRTHNDELFLLVALAVGLGTAALTQAAGLSLAAGAFLAGLVISESDYAHETLARLLSLRDVFVALFFVTIGTLIDPQTVLDHWPLLTTIVGMVVVGKLAIWTIVVVLFGYGWSTALLVGVGLTQIGEFSFILVQIAHTAGHVGKDVYNATLAASLITILINAVLIRGAARLLGRFQRPARERAAAAVADPGERRDHIVLCGFGRVGSAVGDALDTFRLPYVVVENDLDVVRALRARGVTCLYGDASHHKLLEAAHAPAAAMVVVTLPEMEWARLAVRAARALNPSAPILARADAREGQALLREAGATEIVQPEFEAGLTLIRHSLTRLGLPRDRVLAYLERFRDARETGRAGDIPGFETLPRVTVIEVGASDLADQSLREAHIRERFGVTVVAITRADGDVVQNPPADTIVRAGDRLHAFGRPEQLAAFSRWAEGGPALDPASGQPFANRP
ncbi:MAG TPA: cation:proton antiporter [Candidatus Binatia bacterium]|nr:cation:proton antiporter [Candidatus Binatia bacterium]